MLRKVIFSLCFLVLVFGNLSAQNHGTDASDDQTEASHEGEAGHEEHEEFDPAKTAIHHISDGNVMTILSAISIPLPTLLYNKEKGFDFFSSSKFHADPSHHENGDNSYNGYVMYMGSVYNVIEDGFPIEGSVEIDGFTTHEEKNAKGKDVEIPYVKYHDHEYRLDPRSTLDGGVLGGGLTSFYDLGMSKNVLAMIIVCLLLFWVFRKAVKRYKDNPLSAPKGIQNLLEPMFLFIRDEVAIPFIGKDKYMKFLPLLMSIFFFILGLNLFGQVPFLGSVNVTGNLSVTLVLAVLAFLIVSFNGNKHYWKHIFWMPGLPVALKPLIALIEIMSLFIKPLTLMLRLAGNISAGHIAILSFVGLIFIFGDSGQNLGGGAIGTALAIPLTLFMMAIELIVAFVQAFVFTILTASYIGAAIEEAHDH